MPVNALPKDFRGKYPSSVIATYNYTDIAEGTGIINFYGYKHVESATESYGLTTVTPYSDSAWTAAVASDTSFAKIIDVDFDLSPFNFPKTLKGNARINCVAGLPAAAGDYSADVYVHARIRKWDGTTETELFNNRSKTESLSLAEWRIFCFEIACTETQFKRGETLRVTLEVWADRTSGSNPNIYLLHDPKNRVDSTSVPTTAPVTSQAIFSIPFKIDI